MAPVIVAQDDVKINPTELTSNIHMLTGKGGKMGTLIISHDNVRKNLSNGSFIEAFGMEAPPAPDTALPVITFSNDMHFHINGDSVRAIHVANAHTDGDSFYPFQKSQCHSCR